MSLAKKEKEEQQMWIEWHSKKMILGGALIFIAGLLLYMGFDVSVVLMVIGVLIFLKGLMKKMRY